MAGNDTGPEKAVSLRVQLPFESIDKFVEGFSRSVNGSRVKFRTRRERKTGIKVRLDLQLRDGNSVLKSDGIVKRCAPIKGKAGFALEVELVDLDASTRDVLDKLNAAKSPGASAGSAKKTPSPKPEPPVKPSGKPEDEAEAKQPRKPPRPALDLDFDVPSGKQEDKAEAKQPEKKSRPALDLDFEVPSEKREVPSKKREDKTEAKQPDKKSRPTLDLDFDLDETKTKVPSKTDDEVARSRSAEIGAAIEASEQSLASDPSAKKGPSDSGLGGHADSKYSAKGSSFEQAREELPLQGLGKTEKATTDPRPASGVRSASASPAKSGRRRWVGLTAVAVVLLGGGSALWFLGIIGDDYRDLPAVDRDITAAEETAKVVDEEPLDAGVDPSEEPDTSHEDDLEDLGELARIPEAAEESREPEETVEPDRPSEPEVRRVAASAETEDEVEEPRTTEKEVPTRAPEEREPAPATEEKVAEEEPTPEIASAAEETEPAREEPAPPPADEPVSEPEAKDEVAVAQPTPRELSRDHVRAGSGLIREGKVEEAIEEFRQAIGLDATNVQAHKGLGIAYATLGRVSDAVRHYEAYLQLAPNAPDAEQVRAIIEDYHSSD